MKSKTSITLSTSLLEEIRRTFGDINRSELIETAVREYLARKVREARDKCELDTLNRHATALNKEAKEVLSYQVKL
jgi:metal-responsive CopG/Arc/MetJ family transcriptional regulator